MNVSIVVLTFNEERSLNRCLKSATKFSDDVHVLDSGSTDNTINIANRYAVSVHHNPFTGFGDQRNWAIDNIAHKYDWVLHLDADEEITDEFVECIESTLSLEPPSAGFLTPSATFMNGKELSRSQGWVYQVRLFHLQRLRFENHGHGQKEVTDGIVERLSVPYRHFAFDKGIAEWMEKHARYAAKEAGEVNSGESLTGHVFRMSEWRDPVRRRKLLKTLSYALPMRGLLRFIHIYILRRGFLDGAEGFLYARMMGNYESMVSTLRHAKRLEDAEVESFREGLDHPAPSQLSEN